MQQVNEYLWILMIIAARFYAAMAISPIFNTNYFTRILKILLSLTFAFIVFPYLKYNITNLSLIGKMTLLVKELVIGFILSYLMGLPFWLIENVGNLIDQQRGEQFGASINKITNNPSASISKLILQSFIAYFIMANGLLMFLQVIFNSFTIMPVDKLVVSSKFINTDVFIKFFTDYFYWLVIFALPIIFIMFLVEIILGLIGSFLPQLNVTVIAMPIKSLVAIFILIFYIGFLYHGAIVKILRPIQTIWL